MTLETLERLGLLRACGRIHVEWDRSEYDGFYIHCSDCTLATIEAVVRDCAKDSAGYYEPGRYIGNSVLSRYGLEPPTRSVPCQHCGEPIEIRERTDSPRGQRAYHACERLIAARAKSRKEAKGAK